MMKMKKKTLARFLSLALAAALLCSLPVFAQAAVSSGSAGGSTRWSYDSSAKTLTFSGTGPTGDYNYMGSDKRGYISRILNATNIVVKDGITRVGKSLFAGGIRVQSISLGNSVTSIGTYAFMNCNTLKTIRIPVSVKTINLAAITNCGYSGSTDGGGLTINYEGTKSQWNQISIGANNNALKNAKINFLGETPYPGTPFTDIKAHWGRDAIKWAYGEKLFNGVGETEFGPEGKMERGMIVTVLHRLAGEPAPQQGSAFRDIGSTWYTNAVRWAAENGIVNGESAQYFNPGGKVTREQVAKILYGYAAKYGKDVSANPGALSGFSDQGKISSWAREAMEWAVSHGVINGSGGKLDPGGSATRAEVAQIFYNCRTLLA